VKLLEQVWDKIRKKHFSTRTKQAYVVWMKRFIVYHDKRHPKDMGGKEISQYLSHLASDPKVASATQNQALCAIVFLYKEVLGIEPGDLSRMERARKPERLPTVLNTEEAARVPAAMSGTHQLMAKLLHGCGMRLMDRLRLRVKDVKGCSGRAMSLLVPCH